MQAIKTKVFHILVFFPLMMLNYAIFLRKVGWSKTWCWYFPRGVYPSRCSQLRKLLSNLQMTRNTPSFPIQDGSWFPWHITLNFVLWFLRKWAQYSLKCNKSLYMAIINEKTKINFRWICNFYFYDYVSVKYQTQCLLLNINILYENDGYLINIQ